MKQTDNRETVSVDIDYKGNNHTVLLKMLNPTSIIEFYQLLIPKVNLLLTNKYPEELNNFEDVRYSTPNTIIMNRSVEAKNNPRLNNASDFSSEIIPYTDSNNLHLLHNDKQYVRHPLTDEEEFNKEITANIEALLKMKLNTFIEYKDQRHFHVMPTGHDDERNAAISEFIRSKYPNESFNPVDIEWNHCWPIARFDDYIFQRNEEGDFDWAFTQFTNQLEIMVYYSQVEKGIMHHGLVETIQAADNEVEIIKEFKDSTFHLIAFKSKYTVETAYAFVGNYLSMSDNKPQKQPVFGCFTKKAVKKIAENYMDNDTYQDWFGIRLTVV